MYARSLSDDVVKWNERLLSSTWWKLSNTRRKYERRARVDAGEDEVDDKSKF